MFYVVCTSYSFESGCICYSKEYKSSVWIITDHHSTRKISPLKIDDFSLQSSKNRQSKGKISHVNVDSPLLGIEINDFSSSKPKLKFQCQICHLFGHTADRFYLRFNKSSKTPSIHQALSALKLSDFDPKD